MVKLFKMIMCFSLFSVTFLFPSFFSKNSKVVEYVYVNDLCGLYSIVGFNANGKSYGLDINGGRAATNGGDVPTINVYEVGSPIQANQRFEFHFIEMKNGAAVYYITSALDNNGRIDVKNGIFAEGTEIQYFEFNNTSAQRWSVRTQNEGETYQIFCSDYPNYYLSYNSSNKCVLTTDANDSKTQWDFNNVAGDFGINTRTYLLEDNIGYVFKPEDEKWRYLEPSGSISDIINVGVSGDKIEKTTYNNVQAFAVNYNSKFYINTSFVYANSAYPTWTKDRVLGSTDKEWKLSIDSYSFTMSNDSKDVCNVGTGLLVIEISEDNKNWKMYRGESFNSEKDMDIWTLDSKLLTKGIYIRVSYLFEIYTEWKEGWWIFGSTKTAHKNVREVSDSFYVCVDGYGESDLGVVQVHNLSVNNEQLVDVDGYSMNEVKYSETLNNNSMTTTGFKIECKYPAYLIQISKNDGAFKKIENGHIEKNSGKYSIKVTSKFNKIRIITIYICDKSELTSIYFDKPFSSSPNEKAFIEGNRILSGNSDYLKNLGLTLSYSFATVPVYKVGSTVNINQTKYSIGLNGIIEYNGDKCGSIYFETNESSDTVIHLTEPGYYTAIIKTNNTIGDVVEFKFNWWVVENSLGPVINETLIKNKTQEIYDLIPVYYGVQVYGDRYSFEENGNKVEKSQVFYYAFSSYESALSFSLRVEKEYAMKLRDNLYTYQHADNPLLPLSEYELFEQMYSNAKNNVKLRYFSNSNPLSMKIFTPYDKDGNVRTYDDGITESIAYCLEQNTNYCIVTTDKVELAALTSRQPYINNYVFVSHPLDSVSVILTDELGKNYHIDYDIKVEEQLTLLNAVSGKYVVTEKNIFGDENSYEVYYISKNNKNDTIINLEIDNDNITISSDSKNYNFENVKYFSIKSAINPNDSHGLIIVTNGLKQDFYDISELKDLFDAFYKEPGKYEIMVSDRIGNFYSLTITIGG